MSVDCLGPNDGDSAEIRKRISHANHRQLATAADTIVVGSDAGESERRGGIPLQIEKDSVGAGA